jgi:hypothetical protein
MGKNTQIRYSKYASQNTEEIGQNRLLLATHAIHLFTKSDAILNHDALWVIQGKNPNSKAFNVVLRHNTIIFFYKHFLEDNEAV